MLGDPNLPDTNRTLVTVAIPTPVVSIEQGSRHACAVDENGQGWCWGSNSTGQLGVGDRDSRTAPVNPAGGITWASIAAGETTSCGINTAGALYCWGGPYYPDTPTLLQDADETWLEVDPDAVSYTHLTLPTICSV